MNTASYWVEKLQLQNHPEGGYFAETYRSTESVPHTGLPGRFSGGRSFGTAILYLLEEGDFSAFHKIKSDEIWHFYNGDPLDIFYFDTNGNLHKIVIGNNPEKGEVFQAVVPAGCWFGSKPSEGSRYALVGCTVAPGFDFDDFEMAGREALLEVYPQHSEIIHQLTRS